MPEFAGWITVESDLLVAFRNAPRHRRVFAGSTDPVDVRFDFENMWCKYTVEKGRGTAGLWEGSCDWDWMVRDHVEQLGLYRMLVDDGEHAVVGSYWDDGMRWSFLINEDTGAFQIHETVLGD